MNGGGRSSRMTAGILQTVEHQAAVARRGGLKVDVLSMPPYFIAREFVDLVVAVDTPDIVCSEDIPPTQSGFAYLETPINVELPEGTSFDLLGRHALLSTFFWGVTDDRIFVVFNVLKSADPTLGTLVVGGWKLREPLSEAVESTDGGHAWRACLPYFVSIMLFAQQKLSVTTDERLPRQAVRRGRAAKTDGMVKVIHLRRTERHGSHEADRDLIEWSHRWLVRGHWRNQWYASDETHRPVWIAPHIKGPDDKPLVIKHEGYAVHR